MNALETGNSWDAGVTWNSLKDSSNSSFVENESNWQGHTIFFNCSSNIDWPKSNKQQKSSYRFVYSSGPKDFCSRVSYEFNDEQVELLEKSLTSVSSWSAISNKLKEPVKTFRGVFSPNYNREIISKKEMSIDSSKTPRWKPHIFVDRRQGEFEDE